MKTIIPFFLASTAIADSTISWDATAGATSYNLYEIIGSTPVLVARTTGADNQMINVLVGSHTYKLSAVNSTGEGPMTSSFAVTVAAAAGAPAVPLAPKNIKVK